MTISRPVNNSHIYAMKNLYRNYNEGAIATHNIIEKHDGERNKTDVIILYVVIPFMLLKLNDISLLCPQSG